MKLYEVVSGPDIIDKAFTHPAMKIKPRSAKRPDIETAIKAVMLEIEAAVVMHTAEQAIEVLTEAYETHQLINGTWEDAEIAEKEAYEEGLDNLVEAAIEPWWNVLSQDWLGRNTIACGIHLEDGIKKLAYSLGTEYYRQLVHDNEARGRMSANKIMSSAGITKADIEARLELHNNPTEQEKTDMETTQNSELSEVLQKIAKHIGKEYDAMTVYDDFDQVTDDDFGLAIGAAARLGIEEADIEVLQGERVIHGTDVMDILMQEVQAVLDNPTRAKPKAAKAPALKPTQSDPVKKAEVEAKAEAKAVKQAKARKSAADDAEGAIDPIVIQALKDCGAADVEMAKGVGVSRATYNNYANGKSEFHPTADQYTFLRDETIARINKLYEGLAALDGSEEPEMVF